MLAPLMLGIDAQGRRCWETEASGCTPLSRGFRVHFSLSTKLASDAAILRLGVSGYARTANSDEAEPPAGAHPGATQSRLRKPRPFMACS
jgi:hypothetical protein